MDSGLRVGAIRQRREEGERERKEREGQGEKQNARIRGIGRQGEEKTRRKSRHV